MHAEITDGLASPADHRLNRIKVVSRAAKYVCFAVLTFSIGHMLWWPITHSSDLSLGDLGKLTLVENGFSLIVASQIGVWVWCRKLAGLPRFHDRTRLVLLMVVVQSGLLAGYWQLLELSNFQNVSCYSLFFSLFQILFLVWYWKLARLFQLYEQGLIFAAATIRCIKALGIVCVAGWLSGSAVSFLPFPGLLMRPVLPPGVVAPVVLYHAVRICGFFDFHFGTDMDFGLLFAGIIIVLAAWIMDEGRKISEEQALTV